MFEHFTFGAQPQSRHLEDSFLEDSYPSPTDTSCLPHTPPTSYPFPHTLPQQADLNGLVAKLQQQTLHQQSSQQIVQRFQEWNDCVPGLELDDEISSDSGAETNSSPPSPKFASVSCRRLQRQLNVQLQSCSTHVKDINALVENMIDSNSQCRITSRTYQSPPSWTNGEESPIHDVDFGRRLELDDIDEGFCDGEVDEDEDLILSLRRASAPAGIRKFGRSAEVSTVGGRSKIKSLPRMRKRQVFVKRRD